MSRIGKAINKKSRWWLSYAGNEEGAVNGHSLLMGTVFPTDLIKTF